MFCKIWLCLEIDFAFNDQFNNHEIFSNIWNENNFGLDHESLPFYITYNGKVIEYDENNFYEIY